MGYQPAVYRKQGGAELVVASGGAITVEAGGSIGALRLAVQAVNAAGSVAANATAIAATSSIVTVAAADNATGVILPASGNGLVLIITSTAAGKLLKIYPQVNSSINGTANSAYVQAAAATSVLVGTSNTSWVTVPTTSS